MIKRTVTSLLWFLAAWTFGGVLSVFAGLPPFLGPVMGLAVGVLVWWDPMGMLWSLRPSPAARRRLADLGRASVAEGAPEPRRTAETAEG